MTRADLSPVMQKAYDALTEQDRETFLGQLNASRAEIVHGVVARVQARCLSHHVGKHVVKMKA